MYFFISATNCDRLAEPLNGYVADGFGQQIGSFRKFACALGYNLIGTESTKCEEHNGRGEWSAAVPTCQSKLSIIPDH